jgi:hypothetical protein
MVAMGRGRSEKQRPARQVEKSWERVGTLTGPTQDPEESKISCELAVKKIELANQRSCLYYYEYLPCCCEIVWTIGMVKVLRVLTL